MEITQQLLSETESRFRQRQPKREVHLEKISAGDVLNADAPERVEKRLRRIAETARTSETAGSDSIAFERVLGTNDLISISYLEVGLRVAGHVGRVVIRNPVGRVRGYGTGSMVTPRLLLTNNHVLSTARDAAFSLIEFNFYTLPDGGRSTPVVFALDPEAFFLTSVPLDYTLVAVKERAMSGEELAAQGWSQLIEAEGKVIIGEALNIIQHPNGEPKQLALRQNELIDVLDNHLHYRTDTAPGSSGSPVYNDQWEVVALHHSGVPRRDADGNLLTKDGTLWSTQMGEHRIDWIANEGVRVSRIIKDVKAQPLNDAARRLRDQIFSALPPSTVPRPPETTRIISAAAQNNGHSTQPAIWADGSAIWTIPLEIRVNLRQTASPVPASSPSNAIAARAISTDTAPPAVVTDNTDLTAALATLKASEAQVYYDADGDAQARDLYYANLPINLTPVKLFQRLHKLIRSTHTNQLGYKPAVHLYPWVDLHPNHNLRSIYSGHDLDPEELIRADLLIEQERADRLRELLMNEDFISPDRFTEEMSLLEDTIPFNCEHIVPQSWFDKRQPMKGDLHHLFACESGCNSFRANIPYFDFADFEEAVRSDCGKREQNRFEPGSGKGAVARATLYFLLRYPGEINRNSTEYTEDRLAVLLKWHNDNPVEQYERHRNAAIQEKQGNRNPLIDFPELAAEIDFRRGLG